MRDSLTGPARKMRSGARALVAACSVVACTHQTPGPVTTVQSGPACFNIAMARDYSLVDRDTLRIDAGPGQSFEVDFSGPQCDTIDWTHQIEVRSPSSSFLCDGNAAGQGNIVFRSPLEPQGTTCHIDAVRSVPAD